MSRVVTEGTFLLSLIAKLLACALLFSGSVIWADEDKPITVKVSSELWLEYTGPNYAGYYFDVLRAIFTEPSYQLKLEIVPYAIAVKKVNSGATDIALGVYKTDAEGYTSDLPLELESLVAVMSKEQAQSWEGLPSLKGLRVGALKGYAFKPRLPKSSTYSEHESIASMMRMLKAKRLDVVLEYRPDVEPVLETMKLPFVIKADLPRKNIYFAFRHDEKGLALKTYFDLEFKRLLESGRLWDIMAASVIQVEDNFPFDCDESLCVLRQPD
jgi:ABC-type amino acid transport substrate-binding protein